MNDSARGSVPPLPAAPGHVDPRGLAAAAAAFFIWGLMPLYIRSVQNVPILQITAHRLVWGCLLAFIWLALRGEVARVYTALRDPSTRWKLCASAALLSTNWLIYVYGIAAERVVETSLGYFINPLVNVLLGVVVLSERLNTAQWTAVAIAAAGVAWLTWTAGQAPWLSLGLAFSFSLYGFVRKVVRVDALAGFGAESVLLVPLAATYLLVCQLSGTGAFTNAGVETDLLLLLGGPISTLPLVLFAFGARLIPYSTVGLLQYIGPTIQLMIAVFLFREPFSGPRVLGFVLIWTALFVYAADGLWRARKATRLV